MLNFGYLIRSLWFIVVSYTNMRFIVSAGLSVCLHDKIDNDFKLAIIVIGPQFSHDW